MKFLIVLLGLISISSANFFMKDFDFNFEMPDMSDAMELGSEFICLPMEYFKSMNTNGLNDKFTEIGFISVEYAKKYEQAVANPTEENVEIINEVCRRSKKLMFETFDGLSKIVNYCFKNSKEITRSIIAYTDKSYDFMCNLDVDYYKSLKEKEVFDCINNKKDGLSKCKEFLDYGRLTEGICGLDHKNMVSCIKEKMLKCSNEKHQVMRNAYFLEKFFMEECPEKEEESEKPPKEKEFDDLIEEKMEKLAKHFEL